MTRIRIRISGIACLVLAAAGGAQAQSVNCYRADGAYNPVLPVQAQVVAPAAPPPAVMPPATTPGVGASPGSAGTPPTYTLPPDKPAEDKKEEKKDDDKKDEKKEEKKEEEAPLGPTPLLSVNILNKCLYGDDLKDACPIRFYGWLDGDYTYRSTGPGRNNVAPVMNRFGDEFLARQIGLYITKQLSKTDWDWGFNAIFIAGADAAFIGPTAGGWSNPDPRFGSSFTDLNLTAHLPILTDGGVDIKAGRQTTILGPMGALAWQRPLNSSDYAWYNMEEGRFTGVSSIWHVNKQLDIYNGIEIGGWGVFFDNPSRSVNYLGNVTYWLDCEAKKTKVWSTVLVGPTGFNGDGNTTVFELGLLQNVNKNLYVILDTQMVWSKQPVFGPVPPNYNERAYDIYTYIGYRLDKEWDVTTRLEWYRDQDGGRYPGGFGVPGNDYYEATVGLNYHPCSWIEIRPEIRYDHADKDNFGPQYDKKDQLSISADVLIKF